MHTTLNVWHTGHEICDTVAQSLAKGFKTTSRHVKEYASEDCNIAYGILRGTGRIFRSSRRWFNLDNGFTGAGHYSGNYRISYLGTQPRYMAGLETDHTLKLEPFRRSEHTLIVPPTPHVCEFYNIDAVAWLHQSIKKCEGRTFIIKHKDGRSPDFSKVDRVITFNSAIGWHALQQGIIVDSHPEYSVVGSYYKYLGIDNYIDFLHSDREPLFRFMEAHQFTLAQIEQGDAWPLINHYLST